MGDGSSRRGKKNISDKQKQPQRGLGVAQLEKIRLQNQMMSGYVPSVQHSPLQEPLSKDDLRIQMAYPSPSPSSATISRTSSPLVHPHIMMSFGDSTRTDFRYSDPYSTEITRSSHDPSCSFPPHNFGVPLVTLPLFDQNLERNGWLQRHHLDSSKNDSRDSDEPDLELRLSL